MTWVDIWAAIAAAGASSCLALRANMLKPDFAGWCSAPVAVWLSLWLLSVALATVVAHLMFGSHASVREAGVYTALFLSSAIMLTNLQRQMIDARARAAEASTSCSTS